MVDTEQDYVIRVSNVDAHGLIAKRETKHTEADWHNAWNYTIVRTIAVASDLGKVTVDRKSPAWFQIKAGHVTWDVTVDTI